MNFIIIPFKNFKEAKSRMRKDLSDAVTLNIVRCMLEDVLWQVKKSRVSDKNFIVTKDEEAVKIAKKIGIEVLLETKQVSESASVDWASKHLISLGAEKILRVPADIPLVKSEDIDEVFNYALTNKSCVIVPSESGTGTNALLRSPPDVIPSFFGTGSLKKHIQAFEEKGVKYLVVENPNIALDVDRLEDLAPLVRFPKTKNLTTEYVLNSVFKNR